MLIQGEFNNTTNLSIDASFQQLQIEGIHVYLIGHIYNIPNGYSDVEYIATEYRMNGYNIFAKLDGCFLVFLYTQDSMIVARDHHGLGSQFFYSGNYFSNSLINLVQTSKIRIEPNYSSLAFFLCAGHVKAPDTSLLNVHKLEAGHLLISSNGLQKTIDLFPVDSIVPNKESYSQEEYAEKFYQLHKNAISKRIANNKKIGIFLSGGYDSGANLIALREIYNGDIHTYSIGFKDDRISELPQARCMAETFGSIHEEYEIDGSEIEVLPELIRNLGDPFAECGMMVNYCVMGLAGKSFPGILLGGEGNDHYFSTANRQLAIHYLLSKYGLKPLIHFFKSLLEHDMYDRDGILYRANFHFETSLNIIQGEIFGFQKYQLPKLLKDKSWIKPLSIIKPDTRSYDHLYQQHILETDIKKSLNRIILFKSSKIAEMFGNHISYPFVDLDIYNFMNNLPASLKCKGDSLLSIAMGKGVSKYLHKSIYASKMPEMIASKEKQGGFVPMAIFFRDNKRRRKMTEMVLSSSICDEFLTKKYVEEFLQRFNEEINCPVKWFWYRQIKCNQFFNLVSLAMWWEMFVKGKSLNF